jgi:hypothetical protein
MRPRVVFCLRSAGLAVVGLQRGDSEYTRKPTEDSVTLEEVGEQRGHAPCLVGLQAETDLPQRACAIFEPHPVTVSAERGVQLRRAR